MKIKLILRTPMNNFYSPEVCKQLQQLGCVASSGGDGESFIKEALEKL